MHRNYNASLKSSTCLQAYTCTCTTVQPHYITNLVRTRFVIGIGSLTAAYTPPAACLPSAHTPAATPTQCPPPYHPHACSLTPAPLQPASHHLSTLVHSHGMSPQPPCTPLQPHSCPYSYNFPTICMMTYLLALVLSPTNLQSPLHLNIRCT